MVQEALLSRRILLFVGTIICALLLAGTLSSCGGEKEEPAKEEPKAEEEAKAQPSTAPAALSVGDTYYSQQKFDDAEEMYQLALDMDPDMIAATNNLGLVYLQQERNDEALKLYNDLLKATPVDHKDWWGMFVNYMIAASANDITARQAFVKMVPDPALFRELAANASADPGEYSKVFFAIWYNAIHMDMELAADAPLEELFDYTLTGYYSPDDLAIFRAEYGDEWYAKMLDDLREKDYTYFGTNDPDFMDLKSYMESKSEAEAA